MGDLHRFETDGECVTLHDTTHKATAKDIIVVVNRNWYKIERSEDDKVLCLDDTADGDEVPKLCGYKCRDGKDHHYYIRLRKEWKIPAMLELDQPFRFENRVTGIGNPEILAQAIRRLSYL